MNKKGFISVTVIYSFFLIFLTMMMLIIVNMVTNRNLLNNIKKTIKTELSDSNMANYLLNRSNELGLVLKNDNSYRYVGSNPNNYIKFNNEVYRIIGVIGGRVKIIRTNTINQVYSTDGFNDYDLSTVNSYVNTTFYNGLTNKDLIDTTTWYAGGISKDIRADADEILDNEFINLGVTINAYVGLPYITDYIYANPTNAITSTDNWLYTLNMWFMTRDSSGETNAFYLQSGEVLATLEVTNSKVIRPTFFLKNNVKYVKGNGTSASPYEVGV